MAKVRENILSLGFGILIKSGWQGEPRRLAGSSSRRRRRIIEHFLSVLELTSISSTVLIRRDITYFLGAFGMDWEDFWTFEATSFLSPALAFGRSWENF